MPRYICSFPNVKKAGRIPELISDDPKKIEDFARRWDQPGRGVYDCVGTLKEGARRRSRETIAALEQLHVDIDFKDIVEKPDNVDQRLRQLPLLPTEVRNSGGGSHVIYGLKEPIQPTSPSSSARAIAEAPDGMPMRRSDAGTPGRAATPRHA